VNGPPLHPNCRCSIVAHVVAGRDVGVQDVVGAVKPGLGQTAERELFTRFAKEDPTPESLHALGEFSEKIKTSQFRKWFKGSKVVDSEGRPLILFHGTTAKFEEFGKGTWFTTDYSYAKQNAGSEGRVIATALNIKNPMPIHQALNPRTLYDGRRMEKGVWATKTGGKSQIWQLDKDYHPST